jgi:transcriptional regulator with XRE-family HTH domain
MANKVKKIDTPHTTKPLTAALLGGYVRARRTQLGLTIEEAAALSGVAKDTLMKLEHGRHTIQLGSALAICHALGVEINVVSWEGHNEQDVWV